MALPDYTFLEAGSTVTWSTTGDKTLTLTSLANAGVREGGKSSTLVDGTKGMPEELEFRLESAVGSAATQDRAIVLYIGESDSGTAGTNNPAQLTGADAGVTNGLELLGQLNFAGALILSNATGTSVQKARIRYCPTQPFIIPVIVNDSGQTLSATAGNHQLVMTPFYRKHAD